MQKVWLNAIVRNESANIKRCLDSVKPILKGWAIVDTGSIDGTQDIVRTELADIPGKLIEVPFQDFSQARNEALDLVKSLCDKDDYILFLDADEELCYRAEHSIPDLKADYYDSLIRLRNLEYWRMLIVKAGLPWRWRGACHEYLDCVGPFRRERLNGVWRQAYEHPEKGGKEVSLAHAALLEQDLKENPGDSRSVFYYAQCLRDAGSLMQAEAQYQRRVQMGGFQEEIYVSLLEIGRICERGAKQPGVVIDTYLRAYAFRPGRAEALGSLLQFLRKQRRYYEATMFASEALSLKLSHDVLFVEGDWLKWRLLDEITFCAYWANRFDLAKTCSEKLLLCELPSTERTRIDRNHKVILDASLGIANPHAKQIFKASA
jgi:hypothetical protein